ncbi:MAG: 50S ribosomal protein L25 [Lentisphaeria bacterium]|nr:50S ribosomal protein L25 [Lentisphaeria bacterium]NQZ67043.1 50S ribosomal protein L25 [Lentisphaeria bacterium]
MKKSDISLVVEMREKTGSAEGRRLRKSGKVPAVLYGNDFGGAKDALMIIGDNIEMRKIARHSGILDLECDGKTFTAMVHNFQWDYLHDRLDHIDFKEVTLGQKIKTNVPIVLTGTPVGVDHGGNLDQLVHDVEIECLPSIIPENITIDISELDIDQSVTIAEVKTEEGIELIFSDGVQLICAVHPPRVIEEEEAAEALLEGEEGEAGEAADGDDAPAAEGAE